MRGALVLAALICASAAAQEREVPAAERAFVEVETPRDTCFVGEAVRVRVRIGFDAAWLSSNAIPMFRREMDVPARIGAPWLHALEGAEVVRDDRPPARAATVAVNDEVVAAARADERSVDGRAFSVLEIERTIVPSRPGDLVLAAPVLEFAYATRFDEDFIRGRTADDRREARIEGRPRTLRVSALPEAGRPPEFTGAIGRFTVSAEASERAVNVDESFGLRLTITAVGEGDGNFGRFAPPRLDGLPGLHVYGAIGAIAAIDDKKRRRRTLLYDLAALGPEVKEIPAIRFAFFDPEPPGAYLTVATDPIPLTVRAAAGGARPAPGVVAAEPPARSSTLLVVVAIVIAIGAALAVAWRRARGRGEVGDAAMHAVGAAAEFRSRTARPGGDVANALTEFLAAQLGCAPAAVIAPDLLDRLVAAGVPESVAARAAAMVERLVATRYGGGAGPSDAAEARALVVELDAAFRAAAAR